MSRMVEGSIILKKWEGLDVDGRWLSQLALTLLRRVLALGAICFSVKKCLVCVDESQRLNVCIVSISSTLVVDFSFLCSVSVYDTYLTSYLSFVKSQVPFWWWHRRIRKCSSVGKMQAGSQSLLNQASWYISIGTK